MIGVGGKGRVVVDVGGGGAGIRALGGGRGGHLARCEVDGWCGEGEQGDMAV